MLDEAEKIRPKPDIILFVAFQFDPEAAKDIDEAKWANVSVLKVEMNSDIQTDDLKSKGASNDRFWFVGRPDVSLKPFKKGENKGKYQVEVLGFDYFDIASGKIDSGSSKDIAVWMLDTDYDGRCLYPKQVFFPMSSDNSSWGKLAKNLRAEIDEELIQSYKGTISLPFEFGEYKRLALKIIDNRGIESLAIREMPSA